MDIGRKFIRYGKFMLIIDIIGLINVPEIGL
jgi:hypothetical protein